MTILNIKVYIFIKLFISKINLYCCLNFRLILAVYVFGWVQREIDNKILSFTKFYRYLKCKKKYLNLVPTFFSFLFDSIFLLGNSKIFKVDLCVINERINLQVPK